MKRFETVYTKGIQSVVYDTLNGTYAVFANFGSFSQQCSKWYFYKACAIKHCNY